MDVNTAFHVELAQGSDRTVRPRNRNMAHALAGFVEQALGQHLIIGKQRAVQKDQFGAADFIGEGWIDLCDSGI